MAAVHDRDARCDRALILDARVFHSLNALGWTSWARMAPLPPEWSRGRDLRAAGVLVAAWLRFRCRLPAREAAL
ncbi:hypothetical protein EEJ42_30580 [Streptomyces botrytidirepellens]|uniref:Uncharacterized protein n=1 Tax=Streptomyces botrytidirepellens TaxID=2486417 RepID=A0A3M8VJN0_9ACTN|nr:hypothetical protein EEJ42_30580 [Streptomyces botrytidirepellens]